MGKARAFAWREEQHKQAGSGEVRGAYGECQRAVAGVEASERGAVAWLSEGLIFPGVHSRLFGCCLNIVMSLNIIL